jgi:hypothetical protein
MDGEQGWCVVDKKNTSNTSNEKNTKRYHVQSNAEQTTLAEKKKRALFEYRDATGVRVFSIPEMDSIQIDEDGLFSVTNAKNSSKMAQAPIGQDLEGRGGHGVCDF